MAASEDQNFTTYAGDDVFPVFTVVDGDGAAVNISTVTAIQWLVTDQDGTALVTRTKAAGQITFVTTGADGQFQVAVPASVTSGLAGFYRHVAKITDSSGFVTTVTVGTISVEPKPLYTYNPAQIATVSLFQARRWMGDVIQDDWQMTDEEISWAIASRGNVIMAAADCCRQIAAQYSRKVDTTSPGPVATRYSTEAKAYADRAKELDAIVQARGIGVMPYAGGISVTDKTNVQQDTDRVSPSFTIGLSDNAIPIRSTGPETFANPNASSGNNT